MAIIYRGSGAESVGVNTTSLSPGLPFGTSPGDVLVLQAQNFGGTNARSPSIGGSWNSYLITNGTSYHLLAWKYASPNEDTPVVTWTGTGATDDTQVSRVHGFYATGKNRMLFAASGSASTNTSAHDIGPISELSVPIPGSLVVVSAGKSNDFSGSGSLANFTQAELTNSTAGNDAGMTLMYRTDAPSGLTGNLTVSDTGASSPGVGLGMMLCFVEIKKRKDFSLLFQLFR
jgi:hypothetical protein